MTNIEIYKKTDQSLTYQHYEEDGTTQRALTSATVFFTVKSNPWDTDATDTYAPIKKTITVHTNAATGFTTITLSETDTDIDPGNYFWDIKVKESDGNIYRTAGGRVSVVATTTNRTS